MKERDEQKENSFKNDDCKGELNKKNYVKKIKKTKKILKKKRNTNLQKNREKQQLEVLFSIN